MLFTIKSAVRIAEGFNFLRIESNFYLRCAQASRSFLLPKKDAAGGEALKKSDLGIERIAALIGKSEGLLRVRKSAVPRGRFGKQKEFVCNGVIKRITLSREKVACGD